MTKIACYGDSTMYGTLFLNNVYTQSVFNVPNMLAQLLPDYQVENHGVLASTTAQWLYGSTNPVIDKPWAQRMKESTADVVLINTGLNDVFAPGYSVFDTLDAYKQLAAIAHAQGKKFVISTTNPMDHAQVDKNAEIDTLQRELRKMAAERGIPVIDQYNAILTACPSWKKMMCDGVHPTDALYRYMGNVAFVALMQVLMP